MCVFRHPKRKPFGLAFLLPLWRHLKRTQMPPQCANQKFTHITAIDVARERLAYCNEYKGKVRVQIKIVASHFGYTSRWGDFRNRWGQLQKSCPCTNDQALRPALALRLTLLGPICAVRTPGVNAGCTSKTLTATNTS